MIAGAVPAGTRGRAFGFQRAMDHCGAAIGPLLAFALLGQGLSMSQVILSSSVAGLAVLPLLLFGLGTADAPVERANTPALSWRTLDRRLKRLLGACALLSLATAPEAFLVLWAHERDIAPASIALLWATASVIKMSVALPAGILADRLGRTTVLASGWLIRVVLLIMLAFLETRGVSAWTLFIGYAGSLAITEAAERSLVGDAALAAQRGTAYGAYHLISGLSVLPGALLFGVVWQAAGSPFAFAMAAVLTTSAIVALLGVLGGPASRVAGAKP